MPEQKKPSFKEWVAAIDQRSAYTCVTEIGNGRNATVMRGRSLAQLSNCCGTIELGYVPFWNINYGTEEQKKVEATWNLPIQIVYKVIPKEEVPKIEGRSFLRISQDDKTDLLIVWDAK